MTRCSRLSRLRAFVPAPALYFPLVDFSDRALGRCAARLPPCFRCHRSGLPYPGLSQPQGSSLLPASALADSCARRSDRDSSFISPSSLVPSSSLVSGRHQVQDKLAAGCAEGPATQQVDLRPQGDAQGARHLRPWRRRQSVARPGRSHRIRACTLCSRSSNLKEVQR